MSLNPRMVHVNRGEPYNHDSDPLAESLGARDSPCKTGADYLGLPLAAAGTTDPSALCAMLWQVSVQVLAPWL